MKSLEEVAYSEIRDFIRRDVNIFKPDDITSEILGYLLKVARYEALVESNRIVGVISIRDLLGVVQPAQTTLRGLWDPSRSVSPSELVIDVIHEMIKHNIRALPVIENDVIKGIISQVELTEALYDVQELSNIHAKELMKTPVVTLDVKDSVASARRIMLDHGFSHIPVTDQNKLVGIITAKSLIKTFITPIESMTSGDRVGEKIPRFAGLLRDIIDAHPFITSTQISALEIVSTFKERQVSACIIVDEEESILGIITPREVLSILLRLKPEDRKLPIQIVGLSADEDWFDVEVAKDKLRQVVERAIDIHPHILEVSVTIEHSREEGNRSRYELKVHVYTQASSEMFFVEKSGWDLLRVFDEACNALDKVFRDAKHEPKHVSRY